MHDDTLQYMKMLQLPDKLQLLWLNEYENQNMVMRDTKGEAVIEIMGPQMAIIGSEERFVDRLEAIGPDADIRLVINSPGGDVDVMNSMRARLDERKGKVISHVTGLAASAAQFLTLSSDEVWIASTGRMMIHRPFAPILKIGHADYLEQESGKVVSNLRNFEKSVMNDLDTKMKSTREEIMAMLEKETYFTAKEAVDIGLADKIYPLRKSKESTGAKEAENAAALLALSKKIGSLSARMTTEI